MISIVSRQSPQVFFASTAGVPAAGSGEATSRLQAILDLAPTQPVRLVIDQDILLDAVTLGSRTTVEVLSGVTITRKGVQGGSGMIGGGRPMFANRNPVAGTSGAPTDHDIHFKGGYIDMNRRGFGSGGSTAHWATVASNSGQSSWAPFWRCANDADQVVSAIAFYGVESCSAQDVRFYDLCSYGVNASNCYDFRFRDIQKAIVPTDVIQGDNAVQLEGFCGYGVIENVSGTGNDDIVALNANDGQDIYPTLNPFTAFPGVASGPMHDIDVIGVTLKTGSHAGVCAVRTLLATTTMSRVLISNVKIESSSAFRGVYFSNFSETGTCTYRNITVSDVTGLMPSGGMITIENADATFAGRTIFDRISADGTGSIPLVTMSAGAVNSLTMSNCGGPSINYLFEITGGSVADMRLVEASPLPTTADVHDAGSRITTLRRP